MVDASTEPVADAERSQSYVIFRLGGEGYALEVMRVQEVLDLKALTQVPGGPRSLRGVLNLRGHVVPVYDLRVPFELPIEPNPNKAPSILMVESSVGNDVHVTGLLVDRVSDVLDFAPEEIQAAPQLGLGKATPFVRGLIRHQESFLLVLDVDRVFTALGSLYAGVSGGPGHAPGQAASGGGSDVAYPDLPGAPPPPPSADVEPWSERDFAPIVSFLRNQIGITLEPHRMGLLQARLRSRLQAGGFVSFTHFGDRVLKADPTGPGMQLLIDLSTVNHTAFFREPAHFTFMAERVAQYLKEQPGVPVRIWSAGCSSGQEPVSMAMVLTETLPGVSPQRVEIWASDLSREVLESAARAIYKETDLRGVTPPRLRRFFLRGHGPRSGLYRVVPEVRDLIKYRHLDLRNPNWPLPGDFHIIFCRNVSIYFEEEERMELLNRLASHLRPGGWLAMGNGEILPGVPSSLKKHSPSIYRKEA